MEGTLLGVFLGIVMILFAAAVKVTGFLLIHFDFVNSLLMGGMVQFLLRDYEIAPSVRWIMVLAIFIICEIIQQASKIGRIIFTIFSVAASGVLSMVFMPQDTRPETIKIAIIWMLAVLVLNFIRWKTMKMQLEE